MIFGNGVKKVEWAGLVTHLWDTINAYRILVAKPEGKKPLQRPTSIGI
jgi:hypothetical protein